MNATYLHPPSPVKISSLLHQRKAILTSYALRPCHHFHSLLRSYQMPRQQEIRNPLFHRILMPAAPAHKLALLYTRLQQHTMQIHRRLTRHLLFLLPLCSFCCVFSSLYKIARRRRRRRQVWKAELDCIVSTSFNCMLAMLFFFFEQCSVRWKRTSLLIVRRSSHIRRGRIFFRNGKLTSDSWISSSASRGCSGKEVDCVLHVLMAQVRKLRVRSFIVGGCEDWCGRRAVCGSVEVVRLVLGFELGAR